MNKQVGSRRCVNYGLSPVTKPDAGTSAENLGLLKKKKLWEFLKVDGGLLLQALVNNLA